MGPLLRVDAFFVRKNSFPDNGPERGAGVDDEDFLPGMTIQFAEGETVVWNSEQDRDIAAILRKLGADEDRVTEMMGYNPHPLDFDD